MAATRGESGNGFGTANAKYRRGAQARSIGKARSAARLATNKVQAGTGKRHPSPPGRARRTLRAGR